MPLYVPNSTPADRQRNSEAILSLDRNTISEVLIEAAGHFSRIARIIDTRIALRATSERNSAAAFEYGNEDDEDEDDDENIEDDEPSEESDSEDTDWIRRTTETRKRKSK